MDLRDPLSSASHLVTAVWAVYATLVLLRLTRGGRDRRAAVAVYGLSMVLLYLASGTFHALYFDTPGQRRFFQKLDQSAILLLIAGTNTPLLVMLLGGGWRRWFLRLMWALAAVGVGCLWLFPKAPYAVVVCICLGMGWLGVLPLAHYYRAVGRRAMTWVWVGALSYTLGAVCELTEWPVIAAWPVRIGFHEVFHLCDMAGSMAFFLFVCRYVIAYEKPAADPEPVDGASLPTQAFGLGYVVPALRAEESSGLAGGRPATT
jgi:hemolysin III